jgi:hypothetical protein
MVDEFQRRVTELRFVDGIEKVEHVPYPNGDEFWVRFNRRLDIRQIEEIAKKHGASLVKFGGLPSKLPRPLAEILWDGVSYVIVKKISGWTKFAASLGFEPDGIAKIAADAHGPYQIFIGTQEESVQILYEYLGLKYVPPAPPPKPAAPAKPPVAAAGKPVLAAPRSTAPTTPPKPTLAVPATATPPKASEEKTAPKPPAQA